MINFITQYGNTLTMLMVTCAWLYATHDASKYRNAWLSASKRVDVAKAHAESANELLTRGTEILKACDAERMALRSVSKRADEAMEILSDELTHARRMSRAAHDALYALGYNVEVVDADDGVTKIVTLVPLDPEGASTQIRSTLQ